jgi:hypothetical protein
MSGKETVDEFAVGPPVVSYYPPGFQAYVVYYPVDEGFFRREGLKLVYHDKFTDVAVVVRPEVETGTGPKEGQPPMNTDERR